MIVTFPKPPYYHEELKAMVLEAFVQRDTGRIREETVWVVVSQASLDRDRAEVELRARQKLNRRTGYFLRPEIAGKTRMIMVEVG